MQPSSRIRLVAVVVVLLASLSVFGAAFTPGNLVVARVGDGSAALNANATAVFLDEYTPAGVFVQTIVLPTTVSGANKQLTVGGTTTSEAQLGLSSDGHYLVIGGYAVNTGTATPTTGTNNRTLGRIDSSANVDTTTALTTAGSGNIRSVTSDDGSRFWFSTSTVGIHYATLGATTSTQIVSTPSNTRLVEVFNNALYGSAASGTFVNVFSIAGGLATTGLQTATSLPGMPTSGSQSPYTFLLLDRDGSVAGLDTLYVVDDRSLASGGGIQKWSFDGTTWTLRGTIAVDAANGARGLTGVISGGNVTLYATTTAASANKLVKYVDTAAFNAAPSGTLTTLATAAANTVIRGVQFAPTAAAPTVSSINRANASPTNAASVNYTVTFSQSVTGVDTSDFTLTTTGVSGASVSNVSGSGTTYTVTVNTGSGDGTIRLDVTDDDTITNGSTPLGGSGAGNGNFTTGQVYTIDKTAPAVSSINRVTSSPTNAASVSFTVTFTEGVAGVDTGDFALATTGVSGASISGISGSGPYTVTVNTGSGDGTIGLNFVSNGSVTDSAGNATTAGFTGQVYSIDKTAPSVVSVTRANASPTNAASVDFTVTFSEAVAGVDAGDFALTTTGVTGTSITNVTGAGATRTVTVNTGSGDGTIRLDVLNDGSIKDGANNALSATFSSGEVYTIDKTAPAVQSINRANASPTNAASVDFTVTFSENVTGVDSSDFSVVMSGVTGASITNVAGSGASYTVTVNTGSGDGTIRLDFLGSASDLAGNATSGTFTSGQSYTIDKTAPSVVSITRTGSATTSAQSVGFTVTFSESVTGVDAADFALTTTGISGESITNVTGSGTTYTVTADTGTGNGTMRLDVTPGATIVDAANNSVGAFNTGETYTIDKSSPSVVSITRGSGNPTHLSSVHFNVTFSTNVTGVDTSDFTLTTTGVSGATVSNVSGSGSAYDVTVSGISGDGTVRLDVTDDDSITAVSNSVPLGGSGAGNGNFNTGEVYTIDQTPPTVQSITRVSSSAMNAASVDFTVTYSEAVTGVSSQDWALTTTGVTGASVSGFTGSGTTYTVTVNTGSGDGTIRLDVGTSGTVIDLAGNSLQTAFTTGEVYTIDKTSPSVQSIARANTNPTSAASVDFTVTFNESVTGVDASDFSLATSGVSGASISGVTGSGSSYTVTVSTGTGSGTIGLNLVDDDTIVDGSGNKLGGTGNNNGNFTGQVYSVQKLPLAPTSLTAGGGNNNVHLSWNAANGASTYNIKRGTSSNGETLFITGVGGTTYDDSTVTNGTTYFYKVSGSNTVGEGPDSNEASATPTAPPAAPVLAAKVGDTKVILTWNSVPGAATYNVKRSTTQGGPYTTINSPAVPTYTDTAVTNGTSYYYVVTAVGGLEGAPSNEVKATPNTPAQLGIVISQLYGGGGNSGATYKNDFIEIFNRSGQTVDLTGWSVQYASATGTSWTPTALSGSLAAGHYYLIQEALGAGGTTNLPTPDATGSINMAGGGGKTLVAGQTTAFSGACPSSTNIGDLVGWATTANCSETAPIGSNPTNTTSALRADGGCTDTNSNAADFATGSVNPRNTASPSHDCSGFAVVAAFNPSTADPNTTTLLTATVTPGANPASTGIAVTADLTSIGGGASQTLFDNGTNGDVTPGDSIFSYLATIAPATTAGTKSVPVVATDAQARSTGVTTSLFVNPSTISTIAQAKVDGNNDFVPDLLGQVVRIRGIVTSIDFRGGTGIEYYVQDATGGIDVFNSTTDFGPFTIGANVEIVGAIAQFNGLTEITPSNMTTITGVPPVSPQVVTLSQLADSGVGEPLEGKLVTINNVTITSGSFPASGASGNVTINDGTASGTMRIDSDTDIDGTTAPAGTFSLTGVVSQSDSSAPFDCCYQVLPRALSDIVLSTPPTGVGSASPSSVAPNATTLLTVAVTMGQNPPSTGLTVTANLTSIGGSATQALVDNGTNGDANAGDGTFSYLATVANGTTTGGKTIPFTVADAQARSTNGNISLTVQSANAPPAPTGLGATAGNAQVALTWNASAGATGYNVYRATVSGGPYATVVATNVPSPNYTDTTVLNGTRYYYVVTATNATDESGPSNEATALPAAPPPAGALGKIYFIDIGQGASTLIVSPTGKTLLVDGGETGQGNAKVIPTLNTLGISTLDYIVLTHYHIDHDGGLAEVINAGKLNGGIAYDNGDDPTLQPPNFSTSPTSTYGTYAGYVNAITSHPTVTRLVATPGTVIDLGGGMKATIMAQGGKLLSGGQVTIDNSDLNTESISVFVEYGNFDFLVSGDLTGGGSTDTAKTPDVETFVAQMVGDVDVLEFDHHGSTTANGRRFLKLLKAEVAEAEAGFTNTFGHPNRETFNKFLNTPDTNGNTYPGTGIPVPGGGPVAYQTDPSPTGDQRCTLQGYSGADTSHAGQGTLLVKTDGTTSYTLESFDDGGARIQAAAHVYSLDSTGAGITTNFPPTVQPSITPVVPLSSESVTVNATVWDREDPITSVTLNYAINGAAQAPVTMTPSGHVYSATIGAQPDGTRVDYTVTAVAGGKSTSYSTGYFSGTTPISTLRVFDSLGSPLYWDYAARVQGVVTSGTGNFATGTNDDYLQDATGAINVWRTIQPTTPAVQTTTTGNTYSVIGLLGESGGRLRLEVTPPFVSPTTPYQITLISSGGAPTPVVKTIAQLSANPESFEGQLFTINNCTVTSGTIPASGAGIDGFLTISDGTGSFQLKVDHNTDIPGMTTPAGTFAVTGILQQDDFLRPFDSSYDIAPRNRADLGGTSSGPGLITIADARIDVDAGGNTPGDYVPDRLNQTVHIQGVVTSPNFRQSNGSGIEYYIQDATGGVDIFSTATTRALNIGDNIDVVGTVKQFNGLTEIDPGANTLNLTVLGTATVPTPQIVSVSQIGDNGAGEPLEGRLIRINNVTLTSPPATWAAATNYTFTDGTNTGTIRISASTNLVGQAAPAGTFSVVGVLGQFDSTAPADSGYQLFPRSTSDIQAAVPTPASITPTAGTPQSATINTTFATAFAANVKDGGSANIANVNVTFTAPSSGASGTFAGGSTSAIVATNASGVATAPAFTANGITGSYQITATSGAVNTTFSLTNTAPAATHFSVTAPANATSGVAFSVTVTALDASNAVVTGYTGTVHFSSGSTGSLPSDYTFVGGDNGAHTFNGVTLDTPGTQSIQADDIANALTGSASVVVAPPPATHFSVTAPANVTVGSSFSVTVTALAASNATATGYTGTVHFTSSSAGTLPGDYTFLAGDAGTKTFNVTLTQTGSQSITATDTQTPSITGTANTTVNALPATHYSVTAPANVTAGSSFSVTVTALNASNATVTGYTGTVHFTSSSAGTLPADYTFTAGDNGTKTFSVTLTTLGSQSITATDTVTASITGTANTNVSAVPPPPTTHYSVTAPANVTAGSSFSVTVTALNASNATVTGYTGTVHFTSSSAGTLPSDYTFTAGDNGTKTFSVTLTTLGSQSITATDTVTASITGTANTNVNAVPPPPATHLGVTGPANPNVGIFSITVTALDASNAVVTGYTGTVHFTSSGASLTLPADYTFVAGDNGAHTFSITANATGSATINVNDGGGLTGSITFNVQCPLPPSVLSPVQVASGVCANSTGNTASVTAAPSATTYTWTPSNATITSGQGTPNITFTAGASGVVSFTVNATSSAGCPVASYAGQSTIFTAPTATINSAANINVCPNDPIAMNVTLTGTAPFTLHWSDGFTQTVNSGTSTFRTMTFTTNTNVSITSLSDAHCTTGTASNTIHVNINAPAVITQQPQSASIQVGSDTTLTVTATGTNVSYYWYEGNVGDTSNRVATGTASFTTPHLHDTTKYWVRVFTSCGFVDSDQVTIAVFNPGKHRGASH